MHEDPGTEVISSATHLCTCNCWSPSVPRQNRFLPRRLGQGRRGGRGRGSTRPTLWYSRPGQSARRRTRTGGKSTSYCGVACAGRTSLCRTWHGGLVSIESTIRGCLQRRSTHKRLESTKFGIVPSFITKRSESSSSCSPVRQRNSLICSKQSPWRRARRERSHPPEPWPAGTRGNIRRLLLGLLPSPSRPGPRQSQRNLTRNQPCGW